MYIYIYHDHHHVPEGLGMFPVPWSSRWSWSLRLFLSCHMFLCPFGLYCSACFGSLFMSILCTCCSHFFWYCFISFTVFCAPIFCLIHWFFSLSSFVIPSKCLKNFICAASICYSSLFFSTQASLPNFKYIYTYLKFGSEAWVLKKREEQCLEAAQMKFLRHLRGITKLDKEKNHTHTHTYISMYVCVYNSSSLYVIQTLGHFCHFIFPCKIKLLS